MSSFFVIIINNNNKFTFKNTVQNLYEFLNGV